MKRKIVKHGSATLTISLPSKWVKQYSIKPGDSLDIDEAEGSLLIKCPDYRENVKEAFIDISQHPGVIGKRALSALFKGGCDTIRVKYKDPNTVHSIILPMLNEFIGFEIMKQETDGCLVKEISGLTENTELDGLIRRIMLILQSLSKDCKQAVEENEADLLRDIVSRDVTVNRVASFLRRLLNKKGTTRIRELPVLYYIVESLESVGDEYKYLCSYLLERKPKKASPQLVELLDLTSKMLDEFSSFYFKFSLQSADDLTKMCSEITARMKSFSPKSCEEVVTLLRIGGISRLIDGMIGPLLTLRLPDQCMAKGV